MLSILLVGKDLATQASFADELSQREGIRVSRAESAKEAWAYLNNCKVDVVVTDEQLADGAALPFVHLLTKKMPLINCAMVSSLTADDFHEATEGFGIFMQLPINPGAKEAAKMMQLLESIKALIGM